MTWCCTCGVARSLMDSFLGFGDSKIIHSHPRHQDNSTSSGSSNETSSSLRNGKSLPDIFLDNAFLGHEVVVVKNGLRICGTGGALGSQPLIQTKSYFEIKLQQEGIWGIGVATRNCALDKGPYGNDPDSWMLRQSSELFHNQLGIGKIDLSFQEGDVFGVSYDHIELNFYVNGVKSNIAFSNVRGTVYPAIYVDDGSVLDVIFDGFTFPPPNGFDRIIKEKTIL